VLRFCCSRCSDPYSTPRGSSITIGTPFSRQVDRNSILGLVGRGAGIGAGIGPDRPYTRLLNLPSRCTRREASLFFRIQNLGWDEGVSVLHWFSSTQVMRTNQFQGQI